MAAASFAFAKIGGLYLPPTYHAGFEIDEGPEILAETPEHQNNARHVIAQFWDSNANTDYEATYDKNDVNASGGGFSAFMGYRKPNGQRTLNPQFTLRTKDVDSSPLPPETIEMELSHELLHLRQVLGKIRQQVTSGSRAGEVKPRGAAILYAALHNTASPIVLSPRARMMVISRFMEGDAGGKTPWLASLYAEDNPKFLDTLETDSLSTRKFIDIRNAAPDLKSAIREAVWASMNTPNWGIPGESKEDWTFSDYYQSVVLDSYYYSLNPEKTGNSWNSIRLNSGLPVEFVDIDMNDWRDRMALVQIGESFGPNPFEFQGDLHPMFRGELKMKPENAAKLEEIEKLLQIHGKPLRNFSGAMSAWNNMDANKYMERTTGFKKEENPFVMINPVIVPPPPGAPPPEVENAPLVANG